MATAPAQPQNVAFLGLGAMGFAMSTHLVRQGIPITGFDIWKPTLEKFEAACQAIANASFSTTTSAAEAVKSADIIVLMVATHHHVNSALFDPESPAVKLIPRNATVIITATVPPTYPAEVRQKLDTEFGRPDIKLADAPVSGGTVRAANGTLTIMSSSNDPKVLEDPAVHFVLSNLATQGKTLYTIPGTLGAGTSTKALNQVQCGVHIVCGSEIMALAALNNLNTNAFYNVMKSPEPETGKQRYGWTWMFENRGPRMLDPNLPISSAVSIINKDVGIIKDEETRLNIELPSLNQAHAQLASIMEAGMASVDDAWISRYYLGLNSPRELQAVTNVTENPQTLVNETTQQSLTDTLLLAHAIINFQSAYETFTFAEALDLKTQAQRQTWFTIIAGAAGGSRVFAEVIPVAFEAAAAAAAAQQGQQGQQQNQKWRDGFQKYAHDVFKGRTTELNEISRIITEAKSSGLRPVLLETALEFLNRQLL